MRKSSLSLNILLFLKLYVSWSRAAVPWKLHTASLGAERPLPSHSEKLHCILLCRRLGGPFLLFHFQVFLISTSKIDLPIIIGYPIFVQFRPTCSLATELFLALVSLFVHVISVISLQWKRTQRFFLLVFVRHGKGGGGREASSGHSYSSGTKMSPPPAILLWIEEGLRTYSRAPLMSLNNRENNSKILLISSLSWTLALLNKMYWSTPRVLSHCKHLT